PFMNERAEQTAEHARLTFCLIDRIKTMPCPASCQAGRAWSRSSPQRCRCRPPPREHQRFPDLGRFGLSAGGGVNPSLTVQGISRRTPIWIFFRAVLLSSAEAAAGVTGGAGPAIITLCTQKSLSAGAWLIATDLLLTLSQVLSRIQVLFQNPRPDHDPRPTDVLLLRNESLMARNADLNADKQTDRNDGDRESGDIVY